MGRNAQRRRAAKEARRKSRQALPVADDLTPTEVQGLRESEFRQRAKIEPDNPVRVSTRRSNKGIYLGLEGDLWPKLPCNGQPKLDAADLLAGISAGYGEPVLLIDERPDIVFVPLRFIEVSRSKYLPHQGIQEMERRRENS